MRLVQIVVIRVAFLVIDPRKMLSRAMYCILFLQVLSIGAQKGRKVQKGARKSWSQLLRRSPVCLVVLLLKASEPHRPTVHARPS
jgi:hypothetical protein